MGNHCELCLNQSTSAYEEEQSVRSNYWRSVAKISKENSSVKSSRLFFGPKSGASSSHIRSVIELPEATQAFRTMDIKKMSHSNSMVSIRSVTSLHTTMNVYSPDTEIPEQGLRQKLAELVGREVEEGTIIAMGIERMDQGRPQGALLCFEAATISIKKAHGTNRLGSRLSNDLAYCLALSANIMMQDDKQRVQKVVGTAEEALAIYRQNLTRYIQQIVSMNHNLAMFLQNRGMEKEAIRYSRYAKGLQEDYFAVKDDRRKLTLKKEREFQYNNKKNQGGRGITGTVMHPNIAKMVKSKHQSDVVINTTM